MSAALQTAFQARTFIDQRLTLRQATGIVAPRIHDKNVLHRAVSARSRSLPGGQEESLSA